MPPSVFLPAETRHHGPLAFQSPVVRTSEPEFLIEASSAYPKLEEMMLAARDTAWLAFRVFDPYTLLHHPDTLALGLTNWADLLAHKLDEGLCVRLLISDFDPVVGVEYHEETWRSVSALSKRMGQSEKPWDLQVCPGLHEGRAGKYVRLSFTPAIYSRINRKRQELNEMPAETRIDTFDHLRGYHRFLRVDRSGRIRWRTKLALPDIYPVTHHHKAAVFDGRRAVLGGLDLNERRYDDPGHDRRSVDTWHDVSVAIEGAPAGQVAQHIAAIWNIDYKNGGFSLARAQAQCPRLFHSLPTILTPLPMPDSEATGDGPISMQVVQTASRNLPRFKFGMRPHTVNDGLETAHLGIIERAETLVYAETQYFRHKPIAEALARRARECPTLRLIVMVPAAPEDVAFEDNNGLDARYGERLQADCVDTVRDAFGDRALFVCPAKREFTTDGGRAVVNGAPIIYVHAKVMVADDRYAIVSSANLNGRSMKWDSEVGVLWEGDSAGDLRRRLAADWIDEQAARTPMAETGDMWRTLALRNAHLDGKDRRGFILPYLPDEADAFGLDVPLMPPELV